MRVRRLGFADEWEEDDPKGTYEAVSGALAKFRKDIEPIFSPDTAASPPPEGAPPSTGHCAVVSYLVMAIWGGNMVSTTVNGVSHWFNRIKIDGTEYDVDLTGDQFGRSPALIGLAGDKISSLYPGEVRIRSLTDINEETMKRIREFHGKLRAASNDYPLRGIL